jgi:hypothetical protein
MASRTPTTTRKATRCTVAEGAQQCIKEQHGKLIGHTFGPRGETKQWHADGTLKGQHEDERRPLDPETEGPGKDEFGSVPGVGYIEPDPPVTADELVAAEQEQAAEHSALAVPDQPRPVAVSGAPGSRLADVASRAVHLTMDGYPADVHDEVIWTEIATHALVSMREEQARTKRGADPALITAARDAIGHVAQVRGLA